VRPPAKVDPERWREQYWDWVAATLFVLLPVDLLTTLYAAAVAGPAAEVNPVWRWALGRGMVTVVALHLAALGLSVACFYGLDRMVAAASGAAGRWLALAVEVWLAALLAVGLFVVANNTAVVVFGRSII
jgi:hypothetical protein